MVFILFVGVLYLYHREDIRQVVDRTGLSDVISERISRNSSDSSTPEREGARERELEPIPDVTEPDGSDPDHPPEPPVTEPSPPERERGSEFDDDGDRAAERRAEPPTETESDPETEPERSAGAQERERRYGIYFIRVTDEGQIYPQRVERQVRFTDSPMTATLKELMQGPTLEELNLGYLNLIPDDAQLISAWVRDGTAYLNFSEPFQFNTMGVEGLVAQLKQIVYSTTEFPTVERVQILIEGERVRHLGGAGVYVGDPLQRESFG